MADANFIVANGAETQEKSLMVDLLGTTKQLRPPVLIADITSSNQYTANARKHKDSDWYPAISVSTATLTIPALATSKRVIIKGLSVFVDGTIVAGDTKVTIEDTNGAIYWSANLNLTDNSFDFGDGIVIEKADTTYGLILKVYNITGGTNLLSLHGWKI